MQDQQNITILKLEYNHLKSIANHSFVEQDVKNLWRFSLRGNDLAQLPENFFENFTKLRELDLSENAFENFSVVQGIIG